MRLRRSLPVVLALLPGILLGRGLLGPSHDAAGGRAAVFRTEHFDLVYDAERPEAAFAIAGSCERSYAELERALGVDLGLRLPVVVTPRKNSLNAYYTSWPYNRIVVYDTPAWNPALLGLEGGLRRVFHHELAHAVSLNIRTPFWSLASKALGPWVGPGPVLYQSQAFAEGLAVAFESLGGGGRIGDPASMEILFQSKAEGVRPSWADISGSRDIRPAGALPYIFGGAFFARLVEERGLERFGAFARSSASLGWSLLPGKFKKVYGVPLEREFQDFLDSIPAVPRLKALGEDLLSSPGLGALGFAPGGLWACEPALERAALVDPDTGRVLSSKALFSEEPEVCLSEDGTVRAAAVLTEDDVYTVVEGPGWRREQKGLRRPCVAGGRLAGVQTSGSRESLEVYGLRDGTPLGARPLPWGWNAISLARLDEGTVLVVLCDGKRWEVGVLDLETMALGLVENPDGIQIRSLAPADGGAAFSYFYPAADGNLSRYGRLVFKDGEVLRLLSPVNASGGVHHPVERGGRVWFVGSFYAEDRLRTAPEAEFELGEPLRLDLVEADLGEEEIPGLEEFLAASEPYRPAARLGKGSVLPGDLGPSGLVGLFYVTGDPAENFVLSAGAGADPESGLAGLSLLFLDSSERILPLDIQNALAVGWSPVTAAPAVLWTSSLAGSWAPWALDSTLQVFWEERRLGASWTALGRWSRIRDWGPTPLERFGAEAHLGVDLSWAAGAPDPALVAGCRLYAPRLLPFRNKAPLIYNMPASAALDLRAGRSCSLGGEAAVTLLDWEVQKGLGALALHIQRVRLCAEAGWRTDLATGTTAHTESLLLRADFAPILGMALQNLDLGFRIGVRRGEDGELAFVCGVDSGLLGDLL